MLKVEGVVSGYGSMEILHDVSLDIQKGEVVALLGPNGAGKSTLLRTISGLLPCRRGRKYLNDRDVTRVSPSGLVRMGVAHAPEGRQIFAPLTVLENLVLGSYSGYSRRGKAGRDRLFQFVFQLFPVLGERQAQLAGTLSGGEQQMLAIARALMAEPKVLMLDEPSLGLAPTLVQTIFDALKGLGNTGLAILLAEQNAVAALEIATRAYVLELGQVVLRGNSKELSADKRVQQIYLGGG